MLAVALTASSSFSVLLLTSGDVLLQQVELFLNSKKFKSFACLRLDQSCSDHINLHIGQIKTISSGDLIVCAIKSN